MEPDFPASHSMDTFWFAVDAAGQVAMFDSDEAGAVPTSDLYEESHGFELREQLLEVLPGCRPVFDPVGRLLPPRRPEILAPAEGNPRWIQQPVTLVFLTAAEPFQPFL